MQSLYLRYEGSCVSEVYTSLKLMIIIYGLDSTIIVYSLIHCIIIVLYILRARPKTTLAAATGAWMLRVP